MGGVTLSPAGYCNDLGFTVWEGPLQGLEQRGDTLKGHSEALWKMRHKDGEPTGREAGGGCLAQSKGSWRERGGPARLWMALEVQDWLMRL